jgi:hypothetical protein
MDPSDDRIAECVDQVSQVVSDLRSRIRSSGTAKQYELEARFGRYTENETGSGWFRSGVSRQFFDDSLNMAKSFAGWHSTTPPSESHVCYYRLPDTTQVRTVVDFPDDDTVLPRTHTIKSTLNKQTFKFLQSEPKAADNRWDIRVSLSREEPIPEDKLPHLVEPERFVIRQRQSFRYAGNSNKPIWSLDFTMLWEGQTSSQAERNQRTQEPEYQIELELIEPEVYLKGRSNDIVAVSLIIKMLDFLDCSGCAQIKRI